MRKNYLRIFFLVTAALLSLGGLTAAPAAAEEPTVSLSASPAQQRLELAPSAVTTAEVTVINSGTEGYDVKVSATPYEIAPDYSHNIFDQESTYSQLYRWVTFDGATSFRLEPGDRQTVQFTVRVPDSVPAGGQYASIMAETVPPADATGVVAIRRVASLLYANIAGDTINKGLVIDRTWRDFYSTRDIATALTIENLGNTDFAVENRLLVHNVFGQQIDEVTEPAKIIFPDTARAFNLDWHSTRPVGIFKLTQQSTFLGQTITESRFIFLLPVWFIVVVITAGVALALIIIVQIKRGGRQTRGRRA